MADVAERPPCQPPTCIAEGGADFRHAALWAAVGDLGVLIPASRRLGIRADVRLHVPVGDNTGAGDSGDTRLELARALSGRP